MPRSAIEEFMSTGVASSAPGDTLSEVARTMGQQEISCVVICEDDQPVGLISERDLSRVLDAVLGGKDAPEAARDVMSSPLVTIRSGSSVAQAMELIREHGIRRIPVVDANGRLAGLITQTDLLRAHTREIERHRRSLEETVASRTEELARANERLEAMALTDSLLGTGNRRAMEAELEKQCRLAARYGRTFSVALLDVDHFKTYNDCYGHPEADTALQKVAEELSSLIRGSDSIYRYGGEELLLLLPETRLDGARRAAERARRGVEALALPHRGSSHGILTLSVGVAEWTPDEAASDSDWREVVQRADRALYLAKSEGRNRACSLSRDGTPVRVLTF